MGSFEWARDGSLVAGMVRGMSLSRFIPQRGLSWVSGESGCACDVRQAMNRLHKADRLWYPGVEPTQCPANDRAGPRPRITPSDPSPED